jgi:hypothetical protein
MLHGRYFLDTVMYRLKQLQNGQKVTGSNGYLKLIVRREGRNLRCVTRPRWSSWRSGRIVQHALVHTLHTGQRTSACHVASHPVSSW